MVGTQNYVVSVYFCSVPYPLKNYYNYLFIYIILA
jgi:hypothetical protein